MDARIESTGRPLDTSDETYRGYLIDYHQKTATFYVSKDAYRRGIGTRKDARRWVDLLIEGKVR